MRGNVVSMRGWSSWQAQCFAGFWLHQVWSAQSGTPNGRSHTNNLPGHLPSMELRPASAKKSHTQNSSPWNSGQNSKMFQTPKVRDIQNTIEQKSHPPRTRYIIFQMGLHLRTMNISCSKLAFLPGYHLPHYHL